VKGGKELEHEELSIRALYSGLQKSVNGLVSSNIGHCQLRMSGIVKALLNSYRSDPIHGPTQSSYYCTYCTGLTQSSYCT